MKKIIIILLAIIVSSCGVTELKMYQRQYSLKNESGQIVKLKFYNQINSELIYNDILLNNSSVFDGEVLETDQPLSTDLNYPLINAFKTSDSLVIIYNNERKSTFIFDFNGVLSLPIERNPFRHGNYTNLGNDQFQFTFTEEDYENAEDCGGNCD